MYAKFHQKIFNSVVVKARQGLQFFRQLTWFLENKRILSKFKFRTLNHSIVKLLNLLNYEIKL